VESIQQAAIQVLLRSGPDRLTTVRVAACAGVSVGTLYQCYGNKQSLLYAVLDHHLRHVAEAVERACASCHGESLAVILDAVVPDF